MASSKKAKQARRARAAANGLSYQAQYNIDQRNHREPGGLGKSLDVQSTPASNQKHGRAYRADGMPDLILGLMLWKLLVLDASQATLDAAMLHTVDLAAREAGATRCAELDTIARSANPSHSHVEFMYTRLLEVARELIARHGPPAAIGDELRVSKSAVRAWIAGDFERAQRLAAQDSVFASPPRDELAL